MKQILINSEELQVRVAVVEDGKLQDFYMERNNKDRIVGSIFKGRIKNLEPSLQAAFVDIGVGKNAFLHYWDMLPASQEMLEECDEDEEDSKDNEDEAAESGSVNAESGEENSPAARIPILPPSPPDKSSGRKNNFNAQKNNRRERDNGKSQIIDGLLPLANEKERGALLAIDKAGKGAAPRSSAPEAAAPAAAPAPALSPLPAAPAAAPAQILPLVPQSPAAPKTAEKPAAPAAEAKAAETEKVEAFEAPPPQQQQFRNQSRRPNNGQSPDLNRQNQEFNRQKSQNQSEMRRRRRRRGNRSENQSGAPAPKEDGNARPGFFQRLCAALWPPSWFAGSSPEAEPPRKTPSITPLTPGAKAPEKRPQPAVPAAPAPARAKAAVPPKKQEKPAAKPEKKGPTVEDIPNLFHVDQEILVQVTKGPIGTKGARVTTNLSIPGRNLVLLPNCSHVGISRRVEDREERSRLKQMVKSLTLPQNMGLICRTVGAGLKREHFQRDLDILLDSWHKAEELRQVRKAPVCIYQEPALEERVLRDCLTQDVDEIVVDTQEAYDRAREMLSRFDKQSVEKLKLYSNPTPIFIKYGIAQQIENISNRKVMLPSGGYLCIDETEALIAIDVNTGKNRSGKDQPETILETNLEAVKEIARQLRLRNIGGLVVLDLIDMRSRKDQMAVYRAFKQYVSEDHARIKVYPISGLGLLEMSRQRESESLESTMFEDCPYCKGRGLIKTATSVSVEIQRRLNELLARHKDIQHFLITVHPKILERLRTADHKVLNAMAQEYNRHISLEGNPNLHIEEYHIADKATGKEY